MRKLFVTKTLLVIVPMLFLTGCAAIASTYNFGRYAYQSGQSEGRYGEIHRQK